MNKKINKNKALGSIDFSFSELAAAFYVHVYTHTGGKFVV